jgi:hypothetical protein
MDPIRRVASQVSGFQSLWGPSALKKMAKAIQNQWNQLSLEDLAGRIADLEGRVEQLAANTPGLEKMQELSEKLHFRFVFPLALELEKTGGSFASEVSKIAKRVLETDSLTPFYTGLSERQQQEVGRFL